MHVFFIVKLTTLIYIMNVLCLLKLKTYVYCRSEKNDKNYYARYFADVCGLFIHFQPYRNKHENHRQAGKC